MSKIKLKHSSGNSMSIAAPATNPASDLELKLPATVGTANQVLQNGSTAGTLEFANGGKILQVISSHTCVSAASTSQTWADTGLTASITPSSTSSKVLVVALVNGCHTAQVGNTNQMQLQLLKDSTVIDVFATEAGHSDGHLNHMDIGTGGAVTHLNSTNTTSQVTFKVQFRKRLDVNKIVTVQYASSCSYMTLYEVGA